MGELENIETQSGLGAGVYDLGHYALNYIPRGKVLVVSFDNRSANRLPGDVTPWANEFCRKRNYSVLGVILKSGEKPSWYRHPPLLNTFCELSEGGFFRAFHKVVFYGYSMGGYGALTFSSFHPGATVIVISPQSKLTNDPQIREYRYRQYLKKLDYSDCRHIDALDETPIAKDVHVFVDPYCRVDFAHVVRLAQENIVIYPCWHLGHEIAPVLNKSGYLQRYVEAIIHDRFSREAFFETFQARKDTYFYKQQLAKNWEKRGTRPLSGVMQGFAEDTQDFNMSGFEAQAWKMTYKRPQSLQKPPTEPET